MRAMRPDGTGGAQGSSRRASSTGTARPPPERIFEGAHRVQADTGFQPAKWIADRPPSMTAPMLYRTSASPPGTLAGSGARHARAPRGSRAGRRRRPRRRIRWRRSGPKPTSLNQTVQRRSGRPAFTCTRAPDPREPCPACYVAGLAGLQRRRAWVFSGHPPPAFRRGAVMTASSATGRPPTGRTAPRADASAAAPISFRGVGRTFGSTPTGPRTVLARVDLELAAGEIVAHRRSRPAAASPRSCARSAASTPPTTARSSSTARPCAAPTTRWPSRSRSRACCRGGRSRSNVALGLPRGHARGTPARTRRPSCSRSWTCRLRPSCGPARCPAAWRSAPSLARALARNPGVLLLDEPFGALDALTRLRMQDLLLDVHAAEPTTVLLVTHDVDEALYLADRVILLGAPTATGRAPHPPGHRRARHPPARPRRREVRRAARPSCSTGLGVDHHVRPRRPHHATTRTTRTTAPTAPARTAKETR